MADISVFPLMKGRDYPSAGDALYKAIVPYMDQADEKVILDMSGIEMVPSMFLNMSIGRIIRERGTGFVRERIRFVHILSSDARRIRTYVDRMESSFLPENKPDVHISTQCG